MTYIWHDDDEPLESGTFPPGQPDAESADSFALWVHGLLENPLGDEGGEL